MTTEDLIVNTSIAKFVPDLYTVISVNDLTTLKSPLIGIGLIDTVVLIAANPTLMDKVKQILCTNGSQVQSWLYTWEQANKYDWKHLLHQEVCEIMGKVALITEIKDLNSKVIERECYCNADFVHIDPVTNDITVYVFDRLGNAVDTTNLQVR